MEFKVGLKPLPKTSNFVCYASSEVANFLQEINDEEEVEFVICDEVLLKVQMLDEYEKNRIYIDGLEDDSIATLEIVDKSLIMQLKMVEFESAENDGILEDVKKFLIENEPIPICQGQQLDFKSLKIKKCLPFKRGLCTEQTEIIVNFKEDESVEGMKTLIYIWPLIPRDLLLNQCKNWLQEAFVFVIREIPSTLAQDILKKASNYSISHCAFLSNVNNDKELLIQFHSWPNHSEKPLLIPVRGCKKLKKNYIYLTPSCAKNFALDFGQKATFPLFRSIEKLEPRQGKEVIARPLLTSEKFSDDEIDAILKRHFSSTKILDFTLGLKTNVQIFDKDHKIHYFEVELTSPKILGWFKINPGTRLTRYSPIRAPIPKNTKDFNGDSILDSFPPKILSYARRIDEIFATGSSTAKLLLHGHIGNGSEEVVKAIGNLSNLDVMNFDCRLILSDTSGATEAKLRQIFETSPKSQFSLLVFCNIQVLAKNRDGATDFRVLSCLKDFIENSDFKIIGIGESKIDIDYRLAEIFDLDIHIESPQNVQERFELLEFLLDSESSIYYDKFRIQEIARHTTGFLFQDLKALVNDVIQNGHEETEVDLDIHKALFIEEKHFNKSLERMQEIMGDAIGAPKIPKVQWEDVGGLQEAKKEILDTVQLPLLNPNLQGLARSGILLYGPPGVGKTLLAKAVATELKLNFLSVKGPELLNMYIGQSEENVREVFSRAQSAAPAIVFFDELDALAPKRGNAGDSGGVMDRIVSQLLAEMDFVTGNATEKPVFVIGATNRPDLIDNALLRPGRFDRLVFIGPPDDPNEQLKILEALTRKFKIEKKVDLLRDVILQLPKNLALTGADFYAITVDAMMASVERNINANEDDLTLNGDDFNCAIAKLKPSVSADEMIYYKSLRNRITK